MNKNQVGNNLLLSGHEAQVLALQYNSNSSLLASGSFDRNILIWKSPQYQNITVLKSHTNAITSLTWTYTDRLISSSADKSLANWDVQMQKVVRKYKGHTCIVHDVSTPKKTSQLIASVSDDGTVRIWQPRSKQQIRTFITKYPLISVCFSYHGEKVYAGGIDNDIKIFNIAENKLEHAIVGHQDTVSCLQLSPDGIYLMSNSFDETIKIWDTRNNKIVKTLNGHLQGNQKGLLRGGWSKDGLYIACGSIDKCVYIWDTTTKMIVQKLGGHVGTVNTAKFGDNNYLASGSNDKNIIVSQLPDVFL